MQLRIITLLIAILLSARTAPAQPPAKPLDPDVAALVKGNNEFAFDLYRQLSKKEGNIVFSPFGLTSALAVLYAGAKGETEKELASFLRSKDGQEKHHHAFGRLSSQLPKGASSASCLWIRKLDSVPISFKNRTKAYPNIELHELPSSGGAKASRELIKQWFDRKTNSNFPEVVNLDGVSGSTETVVGNIVFFQTEWEKRFPRHRTYNGDFEIKPGQKTKATMMRHQSVVFRYAETERLHAVELPYKGSSAAMVIILPKVRHGLASLSEKLMGAEISEIQNGLKNERRLQLELPRLAISLDNEFLEPLLQMGAKNVSGSTSNYSGLGANGHLASLVQKTRLIVDEDGTIATAATVGGISISFSMDFIVDQPFLFLIHDRATRNILFVGRIQNPNAG